MASGFPSSTPPIDMSTINTENVAAFSSFVALTMPQFRNASLTQYCTTAAFKALFAMAGMPNPFMGGGGDNSHWPDGAAGGKLASTTTAVPPINSTGANPFANGGSNSFSGDFGNPLTSNSTSNPFANPIVGGSPFAGNITNNETIQHTIISQVLFAKAFGNSTTVEQVPAIVARLPHNDRLRLVGTFFTIMTATTFMIVMLRLYSRLFVLKDRVRIDDWFILAALLFSIATALLDIISCYHGSGGRHMWDVSMDQLEVGLYSSYAIEILYTPGLCAVKLSLLFFYRTLSGGPRFRLASNILFFIICAGCLAFVITGAFPCSPSPFFWKDLLHAKCINEDIWAKMVSVHAIVTDVLILLLPTIIVWRLDLQRRQKVGVILMFGMGGLVCITSGLRAYSINNFMKPDTNWYAVDTAIWNILELDLGIWVASVPALRGLFLDKTRNIRERWRKNRFGTRSSNSGFTMHDSAAVKEMSVIRQDGNGSKGNVSADRATTSAEGSWEDGFNSEMIRILTRSPDDTPTGEDDGEGGFNRSASALAGGLSPMPPVRRSTGSNGTLAAQLELRLSRVDTQDSGIERRTDLDNGSR